MRLGGVMATILWVMLLGGPVVVGGGAAAERGVRVGQPAPELTGRSWINSEPLSVATLRGRVVFVEFWTYG